MEEPDNFFVGWRVIFDCGSWSEVERSEGRTLWLADGTVFTLSSDIEYEAGLPRAIFGGKKP